MNHFRLPRQFTLRQLLLCMTTVCVAVGLCGRWYSRYRAQDEAMDAVINRWGRPGYQLELDDAGLPRYGSSKMVSFVEQLDGPTFLDCDMFFQVEELSFNVCAGGRMSDEEVALLPALAHLKYLNLSFHPRVTDRSISVLARMKSLKRLGIDRTGITPRGAEKLRKALPQTDIYYEMSNSDY